MASFRERDLVEWIRARAPATGDDCAVLACEPWGVLLVTVDAVIDGVHAHWAEHGPAAFGYKAVARGLSDIAAMGGEPLWAVIAATLPPGTDAAQAKELFLGAERAGCELVGGDTAVGPTATVTAINHLSLNSLKIPCASEIISSGGKISKSAIAAHRTRLE